MVSAGLAIYGLRLRGGTGVGVILSGFQETQAFFPPGRFSLVGYGEFRLVYPNDSEANRRRNRRVEIYIEYALVADPLQ
jgi:hypothetical protein